MVGWFQCLSSSKRVVLPVGEWCLTIAPFISVRGREDFAGQGCAE